MEPGLSTPEPVLWEELRRRRAELRESMVALETALAAPAPGRLVAWAERVHVALVELQADLREHIDITEGPDGLYHGLLATAPRLSLPVARLTREHAEITDAVDSLLKSVSERHADEDISGVRDLGTTLIGKLVLHRQRGSDLVYEAYVADIGGET
jgi:hypothetical protein